MKRLAAIVILAAIAFGTVAAFAQVYTGQPQPTALVCAYNSSIPTPVAGQFYYVQCDSSGRIMIQ